jgi:hypothetical protein
MVKVRPSSIASAESKDPEQAHGEVASSPDFENPDGHGVSSYQTRPTTTASRCPVEGALGGVSRGTYSSQPVLQLVRLVC